MTIPFIIYLIEVLDNVKGFVLLALICLSLTLLFSLITWGFNSDMSEHGDVYKQKAESGKKLFKKTLIFFSIAAFFMIVIPSKKTIYLMLGGYTAQSIYESPEAKEFGNKVLNIVNSKLDELEQSTKEKK